MFPFLCHMIHKSQEAKKKKKKNCVCANGNGEHLSCPGCRMMVGPLSRRLGKLEQAAAQSV